MPPLTTSLLRTSVLALSALAITACTDAASTPASTPASTSPSTSAASSAAAGSPALALLTTLPVKGRAPKTGYARTRFGQAWTDDTADPLGHNGCDTRNDILRRDLSGATLRAGSRCVVLTGVLHDPYTATTIDFRRGASTSTAVQIDHVVPLGDAWQTGAQLLTDTRRTELANDPLELLAVDGPTNEAKGDGDAATWLPPDKAYRCAYVARQIAVKHAYRLWVTAGERAAMARVLAACPGQAVPTESARPARPPGGSAVRQSAVRDTTPPPRISTPPATTACTTTSSGHCIRGGQLCPRASFGERGRDADGTAYLCTGDADQPRWERSG